MNRMVALALSFCALAGFCDSRVMTVDGDDVRGGMNVVTNVDLSGVITNVDGKVDKKEFVWSGTNRVSGAEYAEKAKEAASADLATRALGADNVNAEQLQNLDMLFDNLSTGSNNVAYATNDFAKAVTKYATPHAAAEGLAVKTNLFDTMTQAQKTELLRRLVEYVKKLEGLD